MVKIQYQIGVDILGIPMYVIHEVPLRKSGYQESKFAGK